MKTIKHVLFVIFILSAVFSQSSVNSRVNPLGGTAITAVPSSSVNSLQIRASQSGCSGICEDLSAYVRSDLFVIPNEQASLIDIALVAGTTNRVPVQNAPVIIHVTSDGADPLQPTDDTDDLRLMYTGTNGLATFDFANYNTPGACYDFKFIFCYASRDSCNLDKCFNSAGLSASQRGITGLSNIQLVGTIPGGSQNPAFVHSAFSSYNYCVPRANASLLQSFCFPLVIIFALLMGALQLSGRNPLRAFDFSAPRLGKHFRYTARARGMGFSADSIASGIAKAGQLGSKEGRKVLATQERQQYGTGFAAGLKAGALAAGYGRTLGALGKLASIPKDTRAMAKGTKESARNVAAAIRSSAAGEKQVARTIVSKNIGHAFGEAFRGVRDQTTLGGIVGGLINAATSGSGVIGTIGSIGLFLLQNSSFVGLYQTFLGLREQVRITDAKEKAAAFSKEVEILVDGARTIVTVDPKNIRTDEDGRHYLLDKGDRKVYLDTLSDESRNKILPVFITALELKRNADRADQYDAAERMARLGEEKQDVVAAFAKVLSADKIEKLAQAAEKMDANSLTVVANAFVSGDGKELLALLKDPKHAKDRQTIVAVVALVGNLDTASLRTAVDSKDVAAVQALFFSRPAKQLVSGLAQAVTLATAIKNGDEKAVKALIADDKNSALFTVLAGIDGRIEGALSQDKNRRAEAVIDILSEKENKAALSALGKVSESLKNNDYGAVLAQLGEARGAIILNALGTYNAGLDALKTKDSAGLAKLISDTDNPVVSLLRDSAVSTQVFDYLKGPRSQELVTAIRERDGDALVRFLSDRKNSDVVDALKATFIVGGTQVTANNILDVERKAVEIRAFEQFAIAANISYEQTDKLIDKLTEYSEESIARSEKRQKLEKEITEGLRTLVNSDSTVRLALGNELVRAAEKGDVDTIARILSNPAMEPVLEKAQKSFTISALRDTLAEVKRDVSEYRDFTNEAFVRPVLVQGAEVLGQGYRTKVQEQEDKSFATALNLRKIGLGENQLESLGLGDLATAIKEKNAEKVAEILSNADAREKLLSFPISEDGRAVVRDVLSTAMTAVELKQACVLATVSAQGNVAAEMVNQKAEAAEAHAFSDSLRLIDAGITGKQLKSAGLSELADAFKDGNAGKVVSLLNNSAVAAKLQELPLSGEGKAAVSQIVQNVQRAASEIDVLRKEAALASPLPSVDVIAKQVQAKMDLSNQLSQLVPVDRLEQLGYTALATAIKTNDADTVVRILADPEHQRELGHIVGEPQKVAALQEIGATAWTLQGQGIRQSALLAADRLDQRVFENAASLVSLSYTGMANNTAVLGIAQGGKTIPSDQFTRFHMQSVDSFKEAEATLSRFNAHAESFIAEPSFDFRKVELSRNAEEKLGDFVRDYYHVVSSVAQSPSALKEVARAAEAIQKEPERAPEITMLLKAYAGSLSDNSEHGEHIRISFNEYFTKPPAERAAVVAKVQLTDAVRRADLENVALAAAALPEQKLSTLKDQLLSHLDFRLEKAESVRGEIQSLHEKLVKSGTDPETSQQYSALAKTYAVLEQPRTQYVRDVLENAQSKNDLVQVIADVMSSSGKRPDDAKQPPVSQIIQEYFTGNLPKQEYKRYTETKDQLRVFETRGYELADAYYGSGAEKKGVPLENFVEAARDKLIPPPVQGGDGGTPDKQKLSRLSQFRDELRPHEEAKEQYRAKLEANGIPSDKVNELLAVYESKKFAEEGSLAGRIKTPLTRPIDPYTYNEPNFIGTSSTRLVYDPIRNVWIAVQDTRERRKSE